MLFRLFNENPFRNEKERKEKKFIEISGDSQYKELIENCIKINSKERWPIEDIINYIEENILEEKEKEDNINYFDRDDF